MSNTQKKPQPTNPHHPITPSPHHPITDLPPELLSLARMLARDCTTPGRYTVEFTISPYQKHIETAVVSRLETIRQISTQKKRE